MGIKGIIVLDDPELIKMLDGKENRKKYLINSRRSQDENKS